MKTLITIGITNKQKTTTDMFFLTSSGRRSQRLRTHPLHESILTGRFEAISATDLAHSN